MFDRYNEPARRALFIARYEATQRGAAAIGPAHLLLGLAGHGRGIPGMLFTHYGLSLERLRDELALPARATVSTARDIPFDDDARRVLRAAVDEADGLKHPHIGTEHLLLGVLAATGTAAASILGEHGLELDALRETVRALPDRLKYDDARPSFQPMDTVRIAVTTRRAEEGTTSRGAADYWSHRGFTLRATIAEVYGTDDSRIDWPEELDADARYDIDVYLSEPDGHDLIRRRVQRAIEDHFHLAITSEPRSEDVYVLTASADPGPNRRWVGEEGGGIFSLSQTIKVEGLINTPPAASEFVPDSMSGQTDMRHLCEALGRAMGRPVIDETRLTGSYEVEVREAGGTLEGFVRALRDQAALIATRDRRDVTRLVVRRRPTAP